VTRLRWGILATGAAARAFARGLRTSSTGELVAVASRSEAAADAFAAEHEVLRSHASYEALLADPELDAVYVATPNSLHAEWSYKAAEAGKHVLCEKPLALNHPEAMAIVEAARRHDVFLLEGFMYRFHPQVRRLIEIVAGGEIGVVRLVDVLWGFEAPFDPTGRLFDPSLGGGAILDIGCYGASLARLLAGVAEGRTFADAVEVGGTALLGESGVDETTLGALKFPGGSVAQLAVSTRVALGSRLRVVGTEGSIDVPDPCWSSQTGPTTIVVSSNGSSREEVVEFAGDLFALEADAVAANLDAREAPAVSWGDSLGNMLALDGWREAIGLRYPSETLEGETRPVHRRALAVRDGAEMRYGTIPGVDTQVSRLVLGTSYRGFMPHAAALLDEFFELGGSCVDTAWVYGDGLHEAILGKWIQSRGVREQVVVVGKGAHTPLCTPEHLVEQLLESLERLRTEYVDVFLLHRDNEAIPVDEFVDVLNEQLCAGRLRAFGGSNWSIERMRAGNEYARRRGLVPMAVLSNQLSLARMLEPPWEGCRSAGDAESLAWLEESQTALVPWSSQAQGFFARADPADRGDTELVRCWYDDDNFARLARARELARARGVHPTAIALAHVLAQPFPTFPIIGPQTLAELRSSLAALDVELSTRERRWLDLAAD